MALDEIAVDDVYNPRWPNVNREFSSEPRNSHALGFHGERLLPDEVFPQVQFTSEFVSYKVEDDVHQESNSHFPAMDASYLSTCNASSELMGTSALTQFIKTPIPNTEPDLEPRKRKVQKPPTTAGITLDNLKAVFGLERPEAEKRLGLKRTTFSNLSRFYGISKWPFRTIRDATNRKKANERLLRDPHLSNEKRKKLLRQQAHLQGVINLMYSDPSQSKDSNTLAVLMNIVSSRENQQELAVFYNTKSQDA